MLLNHWRQFQFFEATPISDPYFGSDRALYSDPTMSGITAAKDYLALVSDNGMVKLVSSQYEQLAEWRVEDSGWTVSNLRWINPVSRINNKGMLVTIAERQGQPVSLKLWDLDKLLSENYNWMKFDHNSSFKSHCMISNVQGSNNHPMTCFDALSDYSMLAAGFANGIVVLVSGDLIHDRGTRQRVVYQSTEPITAIKFRDESLIYVTTISKIFTVETSGKNHGRWERILDDKFGAAIHCSDVISKDLHSKELIIGRDDCIQVYNSKGKSHSIQLEMMKKKVHIYKNRYFLFSTPFNSDIIDDTNSTAHKVIILDLLDKYVIFNQTFNSSISDVLELWNDLYLLTGDGLLVKLHELSIKEKVNTVVNRELFPIAIKLAHEQPSEYSETELLRLHKLYGDYLYEREDFNGSIDQYIKCIKLQKTSEVISRFKESSKIPYLVKYLENMVGLRVSKDDHVTLLLSCYCKLKQHEKILAFIESVEIDDDFEITEKHKKFELKPIIDLCKKSGDFKLASMISQRFNLPANVVSIQLNDLKNPNLAMNYVQTLKIDDLLRILVEYVDSFLKILPNETTKLLIDVFTGRYKPQPSLDENAIAKPRDNSEVSSLLNPTPLLTSYLQFVSFMKLQPTKNETEEENELESYQPPKPKIIFSSFANHNYEFVIFLEACIESYDKFAGKKEDKKEIIITLFEMYLTLADSKKDDFEWKCQWEEKAEKLLSSEIQWTVEESDSLLLISNMYDFGAGELIIRSSAKGEYELDLFRSLVSSGKWKESFLILKKYGARVPELYRMALLAYIRSDDVLNIIGENDFKYILDTIEEKENMTTLELVQTLCSGGATIKLGTLKPYIIRSVQKQRAQIEKDRQLIVAYSGKVTELEKQIHNLENDANVININGGNVTGGCEVCKGPVEFPMLFFKCGHQVHESCLIESVSTNGGCPLCQSSQEALEVSRREFSEESMRSKVLLQGLGPRNRFKSMMAFLGRGGISVNEASRVL